MFIVRKGIRDPYESEDFDDYNSADKCGKNASPKGRKGGNNRGKEGTKNKKSTQLDNRANYLMTRQYFLQRYNVSKIHIMIKLYTNCTKK
jgi:hypothetical protein